MIDIRVLGPLEVGAADGAIEIRRGNPRPLLTYLALRAGETVPADRLADVLWGDDLPANPANALQTQISYLRKRLALAGGRSPIVTRDGGYALLLDGAALDVTRFERLVAAADAAVAARTLTALGDAAGLLGEALALWRGEAFAELMDDDAAAAARARLGELRLRAAETRIDCLLDVGLAAVAVTELTGWVAGHPFRERFHEQLVLALYRSGRQADALRAFARARETLVEHLGIEPGPALRALERRVLEQDPDLLWQAPAGDVGRARVNPAPGPRSLRPPSPSTPILGREREIAAVHDVLRTSRILTLTGPGGAGKTRLAVEVVGGLPEDVAVWFVDLGLVASDDLVATTVADALGATVPPGAEAVGVVVATVRPHRGVLVLDTCEHVVDGAAALVAAVSGGCPDITVFTTSRRPLAVGGEVAWPVPPLAVTDPSTGNTAAPAVRLFEARARAVAPDIALDDIAVITEVCRALDGLPLAIELAAALADVLSPAALLDRLRARFDVLVTDRRDVVERQRGLRAAIDWSYELLDPDERRLFVELAVFAGAFDLAALEAVTTVDAPLRVLAGLLRHSLVARVGDDRYRLLDTIREYAALRLATDTEHADALRTRHARHYARVVAEVSDAVRGDGQRTALDRLRAELPNVRAAIRASLDGGDGVVGARIVAQLAWFLPVQGMVTEALGYLEQAARHDLPARLRAAVLLGAGGVSLQLGDVDRALEACREAATVARSAGADALAATSALWESIARWATGDLVGALDEHLVAGAELRRLGDRWGAALAEVLVLRTTIDLGGDHADLLEPALASARATGDRFLVAVALEQHARAALAGDDGHRAAHVAVDALAAADAVSSPEARIAALHVLALARQATGDLDAARGLHRRALEVAVAIGHRAAVCEAVEGLATVAAMEGDDDAAAGLLAAAESERSHRRLPRRRLEERFAEAARAAGRPAPPEPLDDVVTSLLAS